MCFVTEVRAVILGEGACKVIPRFVVEDVRGHRCTQGCVCRPVPGAARDPGRRPGSAEYRGKGLLRGSALQSTTGGWACVASGRVRPSHAS